MGVSFLNLALVITIYFYVILLIVVSSILVERKHLGTAFTRRTIHLLAGDAFLLLPLFTSPWYPATIPIGLALITVYSFKFRKESTITRSMVEKEDASLHAYGPVYYILSILILLFWLWERKDVAMSAVMVMAWGTEQPPSFQRNWRRYTDTLSATKPLRALLQCLRSVF